MQHYTLITGATGGVGNALVTVLSRHQPLVLHGRDETKLKSLLQRCSGEHSHKIWVQDLDKIETISTSLERFLRAQSIVIDKFVHCAGLAVVLPARGAPLATTQRSFNINFLAAQQITASLLKKRINSSPMRSIVFISSIYSRVGVRGHSIYSATKAALDGLMRSLAVELGPETRVNSILPGILKTEMAKNAINDTKIAANIESNYPLGIGKPEDIANAVNFLLSTDSRWITGQEIIIDGGRSVNFSLK